MNFLLLLVLSSLCALGLAIPADRVWSSSLSFADHATFPTGLTAGTWSNDTLGAQNGCFVSDDADAQVVFKFDLPTPDFYEIFVDFCPGPSMATDAQFAISTGAIPLLEESTTMLTVNQSAPLTTYHGSYRLGQFRFQDGVAYVTLKQAQGKTTNLAITRVTMRRGVFIDTENTELTQLNGLRDEWFASAFTKGYSGTGYSAIMNLVDGYEGLDAVFTLPVTEPKQRYYSIFIYNPASNEGTSNNMPVRIHHALGVSNVIWRSHDFRQRFAYLGSYQFSASSNKTVTLRTAGIRDKFIIVDGVWMVDGYIRDVDETGVTVSGSSWGTSTSTKGYYGKDYLVVL